MFSASQPSSSGFSFGFSSEQPFQTTQPVSSSYSTNFGSSTGPLFQSTSPAFNSSFGSTQSTQPSRPFQGFSEPTTQPKRPNRTFRLFSEPSTEPAFTPSTKEELKIIALQDELKAQREKTVEFRDKYNDANLLNNILKEELRDEKLKSEKFEHLYQEEKAKNERNIPRYQLRRRTSRKE